MRFLSKTGIIANEKKIKVHQAKSAPKNLGALGALLRAKIIFLIITVIYKMKSAPSAFCALCKSNKKRQSAPMHTHYYIVCALVHFFCGHFC